MQAICKSEALHLLRERQTKSASIPLLGTLKDIRKAVVGDAGGMGDNAYNVQRERYPGFGSDPRRALRLMDLIPHLPVSANSFEFNRLNGYANAAATQVTEGSEKAEASMPTTLATSNIATIAHWIKGSRQVLADVPALMQQMQSLMTYGTLAKLESELINGPGGTGRIAGLLTVATAFTPTAAQAADAIGQASSSLESEGWIPGLVVLNPDDWFGIRSERTETDGEYVATGWNMPSPPNIWGVPVVATPSLAAGTALVMDTSQVAILDREQARVDMAYENDDFTRNLITLLAEVRTGLAIFSPTAVLKLTL